MESGETHGNVNETDKQNSKSRELVEQIAIEDTPFTAVRLEDKWFLTLGKYRLTEPMKTKYEVMESAKDASWGRIMQVIQIMIEQNKEEVKESTIKNQLTINN